MRDISSNVKVVRAISPVNAGSGDTAIVSETVDLQGYDKAMFAILTGSLSDANATFAVVVKESGTGAMAGEETAVDDKDLNGTELLASFAFGDDNVVKKIGYRGNKRYINLTITPSGNTGDVYVAAVAILGGALGAPIAQ